MTCTECHNEILRWYDYRPPQTVGLLAIEETPRQVTANRRQRHEEKAKLIRWQQDHIRTLCAANHPDRPPWNETEGT